MDDLTLGSAHAGPERTDFSDGQNGKRWCASFTAVCTGYETADEWPLRSGGPGQGKDV